MAVFIWIADLEPEEVKPEGEADSNRTYCKFNSACKTKRKIGSNRGCPCMPYGQFIMCHRIVRGDGPARLPFTCNSQLELSCTSISFKDLPPLYVMIGGSLNISLSNNPVFSGGHFVRVEPLLVICLSGFRCYPRIIYRI